MAFGRAFKCIAGFNVAHQAFHKIKFYFTWQIFPKLYSYIKQNNYHHLWKYKRLSSFSFQPLFEQSKLVGRKQLLLLKLNSWLAIYFPIEAFLPLLSPCTNIIARKEESLKKLEIVQVTMIDFALAKPRHVFVWVSSFFCRKTIHDATLTK